MAKPNYSFEKRQRELAKKKKKEEKLKDKAERKVGDGSTDETPGHEAATEVDVAPANSQPPVQ